MIFEIIFLFFGILLIISSAISILKHMRIKRNGIFVSATVVDIHRTSRAGKHKSRTQYHPVFEYRVNGQPVRTRGPGSLEVKYPIGKVLEIRYDPKKPERILVGDQVAMGNIAPIVIGIILAFCSVLSIIGVELPESGDSAGYLMFVCLLLLFAMITFIIFKSKKGTKNKIAQRILSKQTANNVLVVAKNDNNTITFQFVNGNSINYMVPESVYNNLKPGDWGNLTFQGSLFIRFERTYR